MPLRLTSGKMPSKFCKLFFRHQYTVLLSIQLTNWSLKATSTFLWSSRSRQMTIVVFQVKLRRWTQIRKKTKFDRDKLLLTGDYAYFWPKTDWFQIVLTLSLINWSWYKLKINKIFLWVVNKMKSIKNFLDEKMRKTFHIS